MGKKSFICNILTMFSGSALSQFIWIATMLTISRLYPPAEFGDYQMFIATASIVAVVATGRYEMAIVIPKKKETAIHLISLSLCLSVTVSIIFYIAFSMLEFQIDIFKEIKGAISIYAVALAWYQILYMWFVREGEYKKLSYALILFPVANLILCVGCSFCYVGVNGLVFSIIVARFIEILFLIYVFYKSNGLKKINFRYCMGLLKKYVDFPKYCILGDSIDSLASSVPTYLINYYFGNVITGYYGMAHQCLGMPSGLVAKSIGDVFKEKASSIYREKLECIEIFVKTLKLLVVIAVLFGLGILLIAPLLFELLLGKEWRIAGEYAQIMFGLCSIRLIASPLSSIYIIAERQYNYLKIQCAMLIVSVFTLCVGYHFFHDINMALIVYSFGLSIVYLYNLRGAYAISKG